VLLLVAEPAIGLAVLAGVGAAALLRPRPRAAVAAALLLLGAVVMWLGWSRPDWLLGAGGILVTVAASAGVLRSRRWPPPRRGTGPDQPRERTARDTWDALDRGEDPTA
jgi:hypothetical protein